MNKAAPPLILVTVIALIIVFVPSMLSNMFEGDSGDTPISANVLQSGASENTAPATEEPATLPPVEQEVVEEPAEEVVEEPVVALSGKIELKYGDATVLKIDEFTGYISSISFTINNGLKEPVRPTVKVYIYDDQTKDLIDMVRGSFTPEDSIKSGEEITGAIAIVPKTFSYLNLEKKVYLKMFNDGESVDLEYTGIYIN